MQRPSEIDRILEKIEMLIEKKGTDLNNPFRTVTLAEFKTLIKHLERMEKAF